MPRLFLAFMLLLAVFNATGQTLNQDNNDTLTVGLNPDPPFIIEQNENQWKGVSIHLWEEIAEQLNFPYRYKKYDLKKLQKALKNKEVEFAITPLTITSERLKAFQMTQPFFISELTVATQKKEQSQVFMFLSNFASVDFLQAVMLLFFVILVFGFLLWLAEKKANPEMFDKGLKGLWDGIWWSAVTMTTVGYGDKAPKSNKGKVIAIIWMFTAVIIISTFTASIASSLTVNTLSSDINKVEDLKQAKIGTVAGSTGETFIRENGWNYQTYQEPESAIKALRQRKINAFIYDAPILKYLVQSKNLQGQIQILPFQLNKQHYGFTAPLGSPLIEKINPVLVKELKSPGWQGILERYNLE